MTPYNKFQYVVESLWNEEDVEMVAPENLKPGDLACTFNFIDGKPEQQGAMFGVVQFNVAGKIRLYPITGGIKGSEWVDFPEGMYVEFIVAPNDRFIRFKKEAGSKR
jgi:hypothetical protein